MHTKLHVLAATTLLFFVTVACRRSVPTASDAAVTLTTATATATATSSPEQDKADVTKKIGFVDTIAAMKLPAITTKSTITGKGPKPVLAGLAFPANAALVKPTSIPALPLDKQLASFESDSLFWCAAWTRGKKAEVDSSHVSNCKGYKYLVIVRNSNRVDPAMVGGTSYRGGHATGDATIFDLDTGERIGAVPFNAQNAAKMEAMQGVELGRVVADLDSQCSVQIQAAIDAAWTSP